MVTFPCQPQTLSPLAGPYVEDASWPGLQVLAQLTGDDFLTHHVAYIPQTVQPALTGNAERARLVRPVENRSHGLPPLPNR